MVLLNNAKGFTLIEVLVSMMVMVVCLTVIMGLFSGGLRSKSRAEKYNTAVELAREKMEEVLASEGGDPGVQSGEFDDGYRWKVTVGDDLMDQGTDSLKPVKQTRSLYPVTVDISWVRGEKEKVYTINTIYLKENNEIN